MESEIRSRTCAASNDVYNIYADQIAPVQDISFANAFNPKKDELLNVVAEGCRQTLQQLYASHLAECAAGRKTVCCSELLSTLAKTKFAVCHAHKGLPEICTACSQELVVKKAPPITPIPREELLEPFPFLTGEEPRVIFLASGGVFRGPFHAGMLACMLTAQIRPHMIVGASVGPLMGGALGALLTVRPYSQSLQLLGNIVDVFMHMDERIAFTRRFKSAIRELGMRGRGVGLSPADVRNMIRRGTRSDAGFAAVGAPAALIDAISDVFMIPHRRTGQIAADFVAGHVTLAVHKLLQEMKKETLRRLDITSEVIGTSLLEPTARTLLGENMGINLRTQQPFDNIAFFATTSDLNREKCVTLGRHEAYPKGSYDFVEAALASSAFPSVFAPLRESDVFPGTGSATTFFSDGGMFDNLPFIPAILVLADVQRAYSAANRLDPVTFLHKRHERPDLFIVGSLDIEAEKDKTGNDSFNNLIAIFKRAQLLENNLKIRSFEETANRIHGQLDVLLNPVNGYHATADSIFINGIVDAAVLAAYPSDADHLNPTFAFCRSTGFKPWRVQKSIADGCFQTFAKLASPCQQRRPTVLARAMEGLVGEGKRIPDINWRHRDGTKKGECPYFDHAAQTQKSQDAGKAIFTDKPGSFKCPFFEVWEQFSSKEKYATEAALSSLAIYQGCVDDQEHRKSKPRAAAGKR